MRRTLPNRRRAETIAFERDGARYLMTVGYYPSGEVGEVFVNAAKANSTLDAFISDAAILVSLCLQLGAPLADIRHALKRDNRGEAASPIGAAVDRIGAPKVVIKDGR
jgi:hypothetical protein